MTGDDADHDAFDPETEAAIRTVVPLELLAGASLLPWIGLVAYGWQRPPFR